jgi:spermidine synthase
LLAPSAHPTDRSVGHLFFESSAVNPWVLIDTVPLPDGRGNIRLIQRADEFSIMLGTIALMNSRLSGSEEAMAGLSWARIKDRPRAHMLIGGLGMGFTLRAALAELPETATITVAELMPAVVAWARGPMATIFGGCLDDPRVDVKVSDVRRVISSAKASYDAILLDVDNGPDGLTVETNDALYSMAGLSAAKAALRPGGVLAIWASAPDRAFTQRLQRAGFTVEEERVRANGKSRGSRHVIWLATKSPQRPS